MASTGKQPDDRHITLVVMGDGGVGKSCLTLTWIGRGFTEEYDPTVEDNYMKSVVVDGIPYDVEIIDTAGQEEYRGLWSEQTVAQGDGFILAYSIDSLDSFNNLDLFMHVIRKVKHEAEDPSTDNRKDNNPFVHAIIATKSDLPPQNRQVTASTGLNYAREGGGLFNETSARLGVNVDQSFESLIRAVVRSRTKKDREPPSPPRSPTQSLRNKQQQNGRVGSNLSKLSAGGVSTGTASAGAGRARSRRRRKSDINEEDENTLEKEGRTRLGKNKSLTMDRNASMSIGGLGRDPSRYTDYQNRKEFEDDRHGSRCKCVIM